MVTLGIDKVGAGACQDLLAGRRIGLITNYSGIDSRMREDLDVFAAAGYRVVKLFTPEHGLYGAMDGAAVADTVHPKYGIPMISLYGEKLKPTPEDLADVDILVYDIQDVGLRYYTYIYTLAYCMMAAAEAGIGLAVLDRPNPLGDRVCGNRMRDEFASFVGDHALAIRYGLTAGELGCYFRAHLALDLDYTVVEMEGYRSDMYWPQTGQPWNTPSPAIHTFHSALCYAGGCFFEATNISEGRGTASPFQIYGAPFIDMDLLHDALQAGFARENLDIDGLLLRKRAFTPFYSKYQGEVCFGVEYLPVKDSVDFLPVALLTMKTIRDLYPAQFGFRTYADVSRLTTLTGDENADRYLAGDMTLHALLADWQAQADDFEAEVAPLRLYRR